MAITESRVLPPQFIEDLAVDFGKQLTAQTAVPIDTSKFAPQVATQDPLQTQAATLAQSGIGSYQPFVQAAQQAGTDFSSRYCISTSIDRHRCWNRSRIYSRFYVSFSTTSYRYDVSRL